MKKPIIFSVLFFFISSISSFGQGGGDPAFDIVAEVIGKNRALLDSLTQTLQPILKPEFFLSYLENGERFGITPEQAAAITTNTTKIDALISDVTTQFETLGNNDTAIGEQLTTLGQNDISIGEQMTTLGENDTLISQKIDDQANAILANTQKVREVETQVSNSTGFLIVDIDKIYTEINTMSDEMETMKAQLQTLVASVAEKDAQIAEKDAKIAELEQGGGGQSLEQVLEQVRDARAGSVVLTVDPEGDNITLGLTIEQSDNLIEWTKLEGEITRTIPIPDGKNFYRFALDKSAQREIDDPIVIDPPIDPIDPVIIIDPPIDPPLEF